LYRQFHPRANIAIECDCGSTPMDGKYYVIKDGTIIDSFRRLKAAKILYQQLIDEMALPPLPPPPDPSKEHMLNEYYMNLSNNALLGGPRSSKGKRSGRFHKSR